MNTRKLGSMAMIATMTALLSLGGGLCFAAGNDKAKADKSDQKVKGSANTSSNAAPAKAASPHLAAKKEMVRKQQEQRITQEQRKTAAKNLQAERKKVYAAKQTVKQSTPPTLDSK